MRYTYEEKIILTKEEVAILDHACILLDDIYRNAYEDGNIKTLSCVAMENISDLLSDEYSDME